MNAAFGALEDWQIGPRVALGLLPPFKRAGPDIAKPDAATNTVHFSQSNTLTTSRMLPA